MRIKVLLLSVAVIVSSSLLKAQKLSAKEKKFQAERARLSAAGPAYIEAEENIIPTDFHRKNIGKIVFSKEKVDAKVASGEKLDTAFNFGDPIEARYFWGTNLGNYYIYKDDDNTPHRNVISDDAIGYWVRIYINGELQNYYFDGPYLVKGDDVNAASLARTIYNPAKKNGADAYLVNKLNELPAGNHVIRLEMWGGDRLNSFYGKTLVPICTGEFTIVKQAESKLQYGKSYKSVVAEKSDPEIEAKALKKINAHITTTSHQDEVYTLCKIMDEDWIISRDRYTKEILYRYLKVAAYYKNGSGGCGYRTFFVAQRWDGTGYQSSVNLLPDESGHYDISHTQVDCDQ